MTITEASIMIARQISTPFVGGVQIPHHGIGIEVDVHTAEDIPVS